MFYVPTSTEIFGNVLNYVQSTYGTFAVLIGIMVGVFVGVLIVAKVIQLLTGGSRKVLSWDQEMMSKMNSMRPRRR
jgi:hypothetical protein